MPHNELDGLGVHLQYGKDRRCEWGQCNGAQRSEPTTASPVYTTQ